MTTEEAFLEDIRERPEDDGRRLIFADWLEDNGDPDRAEFIRVQVSRSQAGSTEAVRGRLDRAVELLARNWSRWVGPIAEAVGREPYEPWLTPEPPPLVASVVERFDRGLLFGLAMSTDVFLERGERVFALVPLTYLRLRAAGGRGMGIARRPLLRSVRRLDFLDHLRDPVGIGDIAALAASPYLGRLTDLGLYGQNLGDAGFGELICAPWASRLTHLDLTDNGLSGEAVRLIAERDPFQRLVFLKLDRNQMTPADLAALREILDRHPALSISVRNTAIRYRDVQAFGRSPIRVRLEADMDPIQ